MCNFPSGNFQSPSKSQRSAQIAACGASDRMPNQTFRKLPLGKLHMWKIATCEVALGKMPLGKYLSPSNTRLTFQRVFCSKYAISKVYSLNGCQNCFISELPSSILRRPTFELHIMQTYFWAPYYADLLLSSILRRPTFELHIMQTYF